MLDIFNVLQLIVSTAGTLVLIATLYVFYRQLRTMNKHEAVMYKQLQATRHASDAHNVCAIADFLQDEEVRMARTKVLTELRQKDFETWNDEDIRAASKVCSSYSTVGVIIKNDLVMREPIIANWGLSICDCYELLLPFIKDLQMKASPQYWENFEWLYKKSQEDQNAQFIRSKFLQETIID